MSLRLQACCVAQNSYRAGECGWERSQVKKFRPPPLASINKRRKSPTVNALEERATGGGKEVRLDGSDLMALEFGRLLGESKQKTLSKIVGKKLDPDATYIGIEKKVKEGKCQFSKVDVADIDIKLQLSKQAAVPSASEQKTPQPSVALPGLSTPPVRCKETITNLHGRPLLAAKTTVKMEEFGVGVNIDETLLRRRSLSTAGSTSLPPAVRKVKTHVLRPVRNLSNNDAALCRPSLTEGNHDKDRNLNPDLDKNYLTSRLSSVSQNDGCLESLGSAKVAVLPNLTSPPSRKKTNEFLESMEGAALPNRVSFSRGNMVEVHSKKAASFISSQLNTDVSNHKDKALKGTKDESLDVPTLASPPERHKGSLGLFHKKTLIASTSSKNEGEVKDDKLYSTMLRRPPSRQMVESSLTDADTSKPEPLLTSLGKEAPLLQLKDSPNDLLIGSCPEDSLNDQVKKAIKETKDDALNLSTFASPLEGHIGSMGMFDKTTLPVSMPMKGKETIWDTSVDGTVLRKPPSWPTVEPMNEPGTYACASEKQQDSLQPKRESLQTSQEGVEVLPSLQPHDASSKPRGSIILEDRLQMKQGQLMHAEANNLTGALLGERPKTAASVEESPLIGHSSNSIDDKTKGSSDAVQDALATKLRRMQKPLLPSLGSTDTDWYQAKEEEEREWTRAKTLMKSKEHVKVKLIGHSQAGFLVSFGRLVGFLPVFELSPKRGVRDFLSWAHQQCGFDVTQMSGGNNGALATGDHMDKKSENGKFGTKAEGDTKQLRDKYNEEVSKLLSLFVGEKATVVVKSVDKENRRLRLSEIEADPNYEDFIQKKVDFLNELKVGDIVSCEVKNITPIGVFVELQGVSALIHRSEVSWNAGVDPASFLSIGEVIKAQVCRLDQALQRVNLSLKSMQPDPLKLTLESVVGDPEGESFIQESKVIDSEGLEWPELESLVRNLELMEGIFSVSKGRRLRSTALAPTFQVLLSAPQDGAYKLLVRFGKQIQEVLVSTTLNREKMKQCIQICTLAES